MIKACNRVGNKNAPEFNEMLKGTSKMVIKSAPALFLDVYNAYFKKGTFPQKWKQQRLVLLPKGKKSPGRAPALRGPRLMRETLTPPLSDRADGRPPTRRVFTFRTALK
ncbi:hypothetical protein EVAR_74556_1 [Eumeta japonica]|uniref:Uncharacterized protein n=1 Tax=Eumeta variegata TaxID=151549 RepID=A0A4C1TBU0_EUMVA|nr:hypothetical protein EVAR_74556_1 [Eumeta japonica]